MSDDALPTSLAPGGTDAVHDLVGVIVGRVGVSNGHGLALDFGRPIRRADEGSVQRGEQRLTTHRADWRLELADGTFVGSGDDVVPARAAVRHGK